MDTVVKLVHTLPRMADRLPPDIPTQDLERMQRALKRTLKKVNVRLAISQRIPTTAP